MKHKLLPILAFSLLFISSTLAQSSSKKDSNNEMKLIYSSSWDWDWHCNCKTDKREYKTHYINSSSHRNSYYRYWTYYRDNGVDNEFDFFSQIGPTPAVYGFSPSVQAVHYNRVNGLFLGIDTDYEDFFHDLTDLHGFDLQALGGYSFGQKEWQYQLGIEKSIGRRLKLGGDVHNVTTTEDYWRSGLMENTISSITLGYDYHDYYKAEGYSAYTSLRFFRNAYIGASYNYDVFGSLDAVTAYNIFSDGNIYRLNPAIDGNFNEIDHQSIGLSLNLNPRLYNLTNNFSTSFTVRAEMGNLPESSNQFLFNKYIIQSKSLLRLDRSTFFKFRAMGGAITGIAPDFKQFALGGVGTMRATEYKSLQGNAMVLTNAELIFGRNSDLDFGFVEIEGFYISLFMDSGWTEYNSELETETDPTIAFDNFAFSDLTHNLGFGIGSDAFRVEFAKPITDKGGFSAIMIRLNPTF